MTHLSINAERLIERLHRLGEIGRDEGGSLTRLAASDADGQARDVLANWVKAAGLDLSIDRLGNMFAIWRGAHGGDRAPVMIGSHIDTVVDAGIYDGCYGVLAGLEVVETLASARFAPSRPIVVAAFTNEEGVRYTPDMMGSLVYAGGLDVDEALASIGVDGTVLGEELARIGYAGTREPDFLRPRAYVELHIEQGPILDCERIPIGAVETLQGISWRRVTIEGCANHAGTTPMGERHDALLAASKLVEAVREITTRTPGRQVGTVGRLQVFPNAPNVVPGLVKLSVEFRDLSADTVARLGNEVAARAKEIAEQTGTEISLERIARDPPALADPKIQAQIEAAAASLDLKTMHLPSGAGHDAMVVARFMPAAMMFIPSIGGISHDVRENTSDADIVFGCEVLADAVAEVRRQL